MIKIWRLSFNPATEYFSFRHLWVLLPSLPLQLWNLRALEAVGNCIGHFISVDDGALRSTDKRMVKILVEVDIHAGLSEVLEIEWRGLLFTQRLDYLGIPFRCTRCRRTGHLRRDCTFVLGSLEEDISSDEALGDTVTQMVEESDTLDYPGLSSEDSPSVQDTTFVGKLKFFFPKLYFSLSSWERDHLNNILFPEQTVGNDLASEKTTLTEPVLSDMVGESIRNPAEVFPIGGDTTSLPSQLGRGDDSVIVSGYSESTVSDSVLDRMLTDLITPLAKASNPLPLTTFVGNVPLDRQVDLGVSEAPKLSGSSIVADPAWSRGLGFEVSPIKTRSARRKAGACSYTPDNLPVTSSDQRALRGMKSLARDKP
jgi:hypothetical protein